MYINTGQSWSIRTHSARVPLIYIIYSVKSSGYLAVYTSVHLNEETKNIFNLNYSSTYCRQPIFWLRIGIFFTNLYFKSGPICLHDHKGVISISNSKVTSVAVYWCGCHWWWLLYRIWQIRRVKLEELR